MQHRIIGAVIAACSSYALYVASRGFLSGADFTKLAVTLGQVNGLSVDPVEFLAHWRVTAVLAAALAALGIVAGAAMVLLRPWSWLLVAGIASLCFLLSVGGAMSGYSRYAFESFDSMESLLLVALTAVSLYAYRRWKRTERHASNA